ncbi:hypothetical protein [Litchfieldella xinjiangensis]|uniref:hypothetical protein n=1 Tax=Litchfieldella xinjiangensis TaxID=1166948 RepID=UPI000693AD16|nr:hypothetical protein [Halomonas xinjiangensis]
MTMRFLVMGLVSGVMLLSQASLAATPGETLEPWTLEDQRGEPVQLDDQTRVLLFAGSRNAADVVDDALDGLPEGALESHDVLYVADISQLPWLVEKVMVPMMRSADYRILLDRESEVAPDQLGNDTVLWLGLDERVVQERRSFDSPEQLRRALEALEP